MHLRFHPLCFTFTALDPIHFPAGKSANILRGAFGTIFRKIACVPTCPGAARCDLRQTCPYAQMFEPSSPPGSPSGLADLPRPFVFRAWHLDGQTIPPGGHFHFHLNLFDTRSPAVAYLVLAFAQLARDGLGPRRSRVELIAVSQQQQLIFDGNALTTSTPHPIELSLIPPTESTTQLRLSFVTPTELKVDAGLATKPEFGILAARLRDRLSTLSQAYGDGPLPIDFRAFGDRARQVQMTQCNIRHVDVERKSTRTGQTHSIGGFLGEATYAGDLAEFLPYLQAATYTGVGRQTVWGKGELRVISAAKTVD